MSSKYENEEFNLVNDLTDTNSILNEIKKSKEGKTTPARFWKWFTEDNFISDSFQVIAHGNFGEVKKAKFKDEQFLSQNKRPTIYANTFAALKYPLGKNHDWNKQFYDLSHEVSCTVLLHPSLVNYIGGLHLKHPSRVGVVMEFVDMNLRDAIEKNPSLSDFRNQLLIAKQIASGMNFLHNLNPPILHRDLRSPNILINSKLECKIADFGISNNLGYQGMKHQELYNSLAPPEILSPFNNPFSQKGDVYFYGWVLVELILRKKPDDDYDVGTTIPLLKGINSQSNTQKDKFIQLITDTLSFDPNTRPSFLSLCSSLNQLLEIKLDIELIAQDQNINLSKVLEENKINQWELFNLCDILGRKLIHQFCIYDNLNGIKQLVELGGTSYINEVDKFNVSCGHFTARNGESETLQYLIANGFQKFNEMEQRFETNPLNLAVSMKHSECVYILAQHADQKTLNNSLISACIEGNLEFVKLFVECGAELNCFDPDITKTPLGWSCDSGKLSIVKYLVEKGANINVGRVNKDSTPIHIASCNNFPEILEYLIQYGADFNKYRNDNHTTPLYEACGKGYEEIVDLLLKNDCNMNQPTTDLETPLMCAAKLGFKNIVAKLLKKGADIYLKDKFGKIVLDYAIQPEIIELLKQK